MDLSDRPEHAEYRTKVRATVEQLKAHAPAYAHDDPSADAVAANLAWQQRLANAGLVAVTWPSEHQGQGLGPFHKLIIGEELRHAGLPDIFDFIGVELIGPTIIARGTDDQRDRYLAPIRGGDEVWCQLFSEPSAGSDLAAVQTRARREDDGSWVVSGQKVWTSNAQHAAFGMLLARTDPDVPKHKGLTMFIVPMDRPGITVRGLRQIGGDAHFNEVFLDEVRLDPNATVGPVGDGWMTAMTTLMFERLAVGFEWHVLGIDVERYARAVAADADAARDPIVRSRLGEIAADLIGLRFTTYRQLTTMAHGGMPGPEGGLSKITAVQAGTVGCDLVVDVHGPEALADPEWYRLTALLPAVRSAGGTEEILRNLVGERVLGLPPEERTDKHVPFSELRSKPVGAVR